MDHDLEFAFGLADLAASISLPAFRDRSFAIQTKADGSPVTDTDVEVEEALRARIAEERPEHMIVGEEVGESGRSAWCWYLDPIDGTTRYLEGDPKWMTLIALSYREQVIVGVVDLPAQGQRWFASRGHGAFRDGRPIRVSRTARLSESVICDDWHQRIAAAETDHPLVKVAAHCARVRPHQDHSALAVACGKADIAIATGSHTWDYAPLKVIVEEAGGTYTDFHGEPRIDGRQIVATNGLLHTQVLDLLTLHQR